MTHFLQLLGLTDAECKALECLYTHGKRTASEIAEGINIHRTNAYDILGALVAKGFVSYVDSDGARSFTPVAPDIVLGKMQTAIQKAHERITRIAVPHESAVKVSVSEGLEAQKNLMFELLERGEPIDVLGLPADAPSKVGQALDAYHQRRIEKKIHSRHIYASGAKERVDWLNSLPYTEARVLPGDSPATTIITRECIMLRFWTNNPVIVRIENKELAKSYRHYFELLWQNAKA